MRSTQSRTYPLVAIALFGLSSLAAAHGHDEHNAGKVESAPAVSGAESKTYFQHGHHSAWIMAHIFFMTLSWVFILPVGVMLSLTRSRYLRPVQALFLVCNGGGILLAIIYNTNTPDLYPNNAHHKLGWVVTWIVAGQTLLGIITAYGKSKEIHSFIPVSQEAIAEHQRNHIPRRESYRFSYDSGHGTETNTESRSPSEDNRLSPYSPESEVDEHEKQDLEQGGKLDQLLSKLIPGTLSKRLLRTLEFLNNAVDRVILLVGFAAFCTGWVTFGGLFRGQALFSGLAHFIKGGVFFWFGILTLGRWAGCFAEFGWAWNIKSETVSGKRQLTAEFAESFLIFFYGCSNMFLEHLSAWGGEWSAMDLEHISLTIMFFGGGLCGMLVESKKLRFLLSARSESSNHLQYSADKDMLEEPASYTVPMNPIPALVILLLGMMMSSHHQESMVSTMIHAQWGNLLIGAAFARAATYILLYLSPPKSILPGRPPTELITAFCFMAGGMIFMASARDVVETIELYGLDAMFVFTVSMGVITFLMAWVIVVVAIKGWAVRKESRLVNFGSTA